jgi:hypothetical protein
MDIAGKDLPHSVSCSFWIFFSFAVQKIFDLMQSHLLILAFISWASGAYSENSCLCLYLQGSSKCSPTVVSNFQISHSGL